MTESIINDNLTINEHTENAMIEMEWSEEHENILIDWADKAMCYRWLHAQANRKYAKLTKWFTIPVIIISTLTGTANFAQERVPDEHVPTFVMVVGAFNIMAGIISTIAQFLKINELNESHRVSSISWDKFYRNIKIELAKNPKERIPVSQMIKFSKEEFDRLMETSPIIQNDIISRFNKTFKEKQSFNDIRKPEICDDLVSTDTFRFIAKSVSPEQSSRLHKVVLKAKDMKKKINMIQDFYDKFKDIQGRPPTKEEIMDSIQHEYKDLKNMKENEISYAVEKFLIDTEKNILNNSNSKQNMFENEVVAT